MREQLLATLSEQITAARRTELDLCEASHEHREDWEEIHERQDDLLEVAQILEVGCEQVCMALLAAHRNCQSAHEELAEFLEDKVLTPEQAFVLSLKLAQ